MRAARPTEAAATATATTAAATSTAVMSPPILRRASVSRQSGQWRDDDYDVLEDGVVVGRIFWSPSAPKHRPWMWTYKEQQGRPPAFGYEPTREAAMAAFAKSWRRN